MTEQPSARVGEIVAAARELLEDGGPEALTMRAVADKLGIRAPSLYKHIPDKADLEALVVTAAFTEQAEAFSRAIARARDPLTALGRGLPRLGARASAPLPAHDQPTPRPRPAPGGRRGQRGRATDRSVRR